MAGKSGERSGKVPGSLADTLADLARRHRLTLIIQFGSTVQGGKHERSDLDIGVQFGSGSPSVQTVLEIQSALQRAFPGRDLDLAVINHADPLFLHEMTASCYLLYGDPSALARLRIYAFKRYQDHRRFLDMERQYVEKRLSALRVGR